ncbi:MAG: thiamine-phosphate kinase [Bacteroidales bacterium]|nr:thiamine-phosphate kinase [Bacteroidales bacterium]
MEQLEYQEGRTELATLGKVALIDRLSADFEPKNGTTAKGIGDDCAVLDRDDRQYTLVNTQTLVEGVNFDMMYTPLKHLGYKAVALAISNITAMNGTPCQILVSLAVSNRYSVEALDELYAGVRLCCQRYDVDLVGGETGTSRAGMVITVTAIGNVDKDKIAYRCGAGLHDLVCVSGDLGSAYAGLLILEREKVTYQANPNFQPDLDGYDYVLERFLKPEPRTDIVKMLAEKQVVPTSMTDVSKGLADSLLHLCKESHCGCEVYEDRLPIDYQTTRVCSEMSNNMLPVSCALNGGEDYELLFTISQKDYEKLKDEQSIHIIGHITEQGSPAVMVTPQNTTITLRAQGWQSDQ